MIKVGEPLRYVNEVRDSNGLIDISSWTITAKARSGSETGPVLGDYTVNHISLGVYELTLSTAGFQPGMVCTDVKLVNGSGDVFITDTDKVPLLPAVTS